MASTLAMPALEELSSDTSEELVQTRKPKKAESKREKGRPKKEKLEKPKKEKEKEKQEKEKRKKKLEQEKPEQEKSEEEKPEKKPKKEKRKKKKPEQEKSEQEKPEEERPEEERPEKKPKKEKQEKEKRKKKKPEQEKSEQEKPNERRGSLCLPERQCIKRDEHRAASLIRRRKNSFAIYFPKVLKNIHVGLSLSKRSLNILDSFVKDMFERIASEASFLARQSRSPTINSREIQTAVRLLLPGELCKRAVAEGTMAMVRYISSK